MSKKQAKSSNMPAAPTELIGDIRRLIDETRAAAAAAVNVALTMLYWRIGGRINREILKGKRADYGAEIVSALSRQLEAEYGSGFAEKNLRRMIQFAEVFPDEQIVVSLIRQLSWTHFIALIPLKDPLQRDFYAEMCRVERWSVRTLRQKIGSMLYERTALSRKKTWKRPFCANWKPLSWSWAPASLSSPARNASSLITTIFISTCSFSTAVCVG